MPLLIEPLTSTMNFSLTQLDQDINQDFTQPLEEEVRPAKELLLSLPGQPAAKNQTQKSADMSTIEGIDFSIEIQNTSIMRDYVDYYTRRQRKTFSRWLRRSEKYLPYVRKVFRKKDLPQDLIFLPFAESGFNPWAYSRAGAAGLWQFMPRTAQHYGLKVNWWVDERRDPYSSTRAAARYLKKLYKQFDSWYLALAAYNAGEGTVERALHRSGSDGFFELSHDSPYLRRETRFYVPKFLAILKIVKNLQDYGFQQLNLDRRRELARFELPPGTDLGRMCTSMDMEWDAFRKLNPSLRRRVTPSDNPITVHLPQGKKKLAQRFLERSDSRPHSGYARYRIRHGDSWWRLSRRFDVPISILKDLNNTTSNLLHPGESIIVPTGRAKASSSGSEGKESATYVVKRGDTLSEIAQRFGLSVSKLRRINGMHRGEHLIRPGQRLAIPRTGHSQKRMLARRRSNYTVQKGDSLWEISRKFGVSIATLRDANGLEKGNSLQVGARLFIPGQSDSPQRTASGNAIVYRVKKGDNLWSIARSFGVNTSQIVSWNSIGEDTTIHPGDKLRIRIQK
ncbi:MAG: LysM peptidoglycan-binding domain-containing protein [Desulfohalobiaceae bacterium]|nr:LysM peptidoglycan-binding domain-containing protein [Desulfohalobiaceae bacterium]